MAKLSFAAFIAGAAASRSEEGVAYLQTGSMEQRLTSITDADTDAGARRAHKLLSMKEQIVSFAQSDVPAAAQPLLTTIADSLRDDVLPEILAERNSALDTHNNLYASFQTASNTYAGSLGSLPPDGTAEKAAHMDVCRAAESIDHGEVVVCDGQEIAARQKFSQDETAVKALGSTHDVCGDGWEDATDLNLEAYISAGHTAISSRNDMQAKIAECAGLNDDLVAKNAECDGLQTTYETVACARAQAVKNAGDTYTEDYNNAKGLFEAEFAVWAAQEDNRVKQCRLVKTLICYVDALHNYDDKAALQQEVDACDEAHDSHNCDDMTFTVNATPDADAVTPTPPYPCQDSFDYGTFPAGTAAGTCTVCAGM